MRERLLFLFIPLAISCSRQNNEGQFDTKPTIYPDTVIGNHVISAQLPGGTFGKKAKQYYVVSNSDTSDFRCSVFEERSGRVGFDIRFKQTMTYRDQWRQLVKILPYIFVDFDINTANLQTVFISRLITTGDLAAEVSRVYQEAFGENDRKLNYAKINSFLMDTRLVHDWNELLKVYSVQVDTVFTEKLYFTEKKELYDINQIETDSALVPHRILDCMIWLRLKKKRMYAS